MRHVIGMKVRYVCIDMKQIGKNMYMIRKYVHFQNKAPDPVYSLPRR